MIMAKIRNPKREIRNKSEIRMFQTFLLRSFVLVSDFVLRISDLDSRLLEAREIDNSSDWRSRPRFAAHDRELAQRVAGLAQAAQHVLAHLGLDANAVGVQHALAELFGVHRGLLPRQVWWHGAFTVRARALANYRSLTL
jgi:hypothetical protein